MLYSIRDSTDIEYDASCFSPISIKCDNLSGKSPKSFAEESLKLKQRNIQHSLLCLGINCDLPWS